MNSKYFGSVKFDEYNSDNNDENNFLNLGLSHNSQQLIVNLYHLFDENDVYRDRFEDILYSIFDDISKFKKENERLENAHKHEKENNEDMMTSMIEEAERQLVLTSERIREELINDYEKTIEKLTQQHHAEVSVLHETLNKMKTDEAHNKEQVQKEKLKIAELNQQIQLLKDEKRSLVASQRELTTQATILRSEVALLKATYEGREHFHKENSLIEYNIESCELKNEINILQETNKKLNDTNDVLLNELSCLRLNSSSSSRKASTPNNYKITPQTKFFSNRPNYMPTSGFNMTNELDSLEIVSDDETDSGNWTISSDLNETEAIKSQFSKELEFRKKSPTLDSIAELTTAKPKIGKGVPEKMFKICFFGDSAVGKTSFIMRYCMGEFYTSTSATLGLDFHMRVIEHDEKSIALQLWDTCGQERFRSIAISYFRKADGAVLMYDCNSEKSFLNVREWIQSINYMSDRSVPIILIANKIDLREESRSNGKRVISYEEGLKLADNFGSKFFECSTKDGVNIDESLIELCGMMASNQAKEIDESSNIKLGNQKFGISTKKCC